MAIHACCHVLCCERTDLTCQRAAAGCGFGNTNRDFSTGRHSLFLLLSIRFCFESVMTHVRCKHQRGTYPPCSASSSKCRFASQANVTGSVRFPGRDVICASGSDADRHGEICVKRSVQIFFCVQPLVSHCLSIKRQVLRRADSSFAVDNKTSPPPPRQNRVRKTRDGQCCHDESEVMAVEHEKEV